MRSGVAVVDPADPNRPPSLDDLRAFAGRQLAHHKLPERLLVVDELPLTPMEKVDKRALQALITPAAGPGSGSTPVGG